MYDENNIFAKILRKEIPCDKIYEDEFCLFFNDINSLIFFTIINSILLGIRIFYEEKANKFRRKL